MTTDEVKGGESTPSAFPPVSAPPPPKSRKLWIILLAVLAGLAVLGTGSYIGVRSLMRGFSGVQADAGAIADTVLGQIRDGAYDKVWEQAAPEFRRVTSQEQFRNFLSSLQPTVGKPLTWQMTGVQKKAFVGTGGTQNTTIYTYRVTHERGTSTVTLTVDGAKRLLGLNFQFGQ